MTEIPRDDWIERFATRLVFRWQSQTVADALGHAAIAWPDGGDLPPEDMADVYMAERASKMNEED